jgi:uncharacterized membrane protein HdeD (DUF308 family)
MTASPQVPGLLPGNLLTLHRGEVVAIAIVGLVLGIVALVWPDATLVTVAVVFGLYLIMSGLFRLSVAILSRTSTTGWRWFGGVLGVLVVAAGIYCLVNPVQSLAVLAWVIGFGWIAEGIIDIMAGIQGLVSPTWLAILSGVVSIIAGIIVFTLPALAIQTFLIFGAVLLIVVSITTLFTLPRKHSVAS